MKKLEAAAVHSSFIAVVACLAGLVIMFCSSPALAIDDEWTPIKPRLCTATTQRWLERHTGEDGRGVFDGSGRLLRGFVLNDFNQFGATIVGQFQQIDRWGAYTIMYIDVGPTINPRLNKPGICIRAQMITDREVPQPQ